MRIKSYCAISKKELDGDMFLISHNNDSLSIIDCCINDKNEQRIRKDLELWGFSKIIRRFISTHPDEDHISGLTKINPKFYANFYCVKNKIEKPDYDEDFELYKKLRDQEIKDSKVFYIDNTMQVKWLNDSDIERKSSFLSFIWPNINNKYFIDELKKCNNSENDNNICPIIKYNDGFRCIYWFGDLENEYLEKIKNDVEWEKADIVFAPHHGRDSGSLPKEILDILDPKLIIIGNCDSEYLNYYPGYDTITQNSSKDIILDFRDGFVHIYSENPEYDPGFNLIPVNVTKIIDNTRYIGSVQLR